MSAGRTAMLWLALFTHGAGAVVFEERDFATPEAARRYRVLTEELRCLVCQNQSLAESEADLAGDLRERIHAMLEEGAGDREIIDYMVERYGDFVLYRPPLKATTLVLWAGPFLAGVVCLWVLFAQIRRRSVQAVGPPLDGAERERLQRLLESEGDPGAGG